jgi:hypothetical protein
MDESFDLASQFPDLEEFEGRPAEESPGELKIEGIELYPAGDGRRVVVGLVVTPTHERPNIEVVILTPDGMVVAETFIVEARSARQVVTLHLRPSDPSLAYTVKAALFQGKELVDTCEAELTWSQ